MSMRTLKIVVAALVSLSGAPVAAQQTDGWVSLFDGKTLDGWKVGENAASFKVEDGYIVINGGYWLVSLIVMGTILGAWR